MRRKYAALPLLAVVLLCLAAFSGCGDSGGGTEPAEESLLFTDDLGREVSLEGVPERIVSASPACTEILFALGLGDLSLIHIRRCRRSTVCSSRLSPYH